MEEIPVLGHGGIPDQRQRVADGTRIHTHMCYSKFNDIIAAIADMDTDVITPETARSDWKLPKTFEHFEYPNEIGPGGYDIHSSSIPDRADIVQLMQQAAHSCRTPLGRPRLRPQDTSVGRGDSCPAAHGGGCQDIAPEDQAGRARPSAVIAPAFSDMPRTLSRAFQGEMKRTSAADVAKFAADAAAAAKTCGGA